MNVCKKMILTVFMVSFTLRAIAERKFRICQVRTSAYGTTVDNDPVRNKRSAGVRILCGSGCTVFLHSAVYTSFKLIPSVDFARCDPAHLSSHKEENQEVQKGYNN